MKPFKVLRVVPRDDVYLENYLGNPGEIFYDQATNSLRVFDGQTLGGYDLARADLSNVPDQDVIDKVSLEGFLLDTEVYNNPSWIGSLSGTKIVGNISGRAGSVTNGVYTTDTGTVTNTMLAGSIANNKLVNNSVTIGSTTFELGSTGTTISGLSSLSATSITGALTGNATTATRLQTARTINGVSFDGSGNITVTAAATTLTGTTLNSTVVNSSLTSVGTLTSLAVTGTATVNGVVTVNNTVTVTDDITAESNIVVDQAPTQVNHATNKRYTDSRSIAMSIALS